VFIQVLLLYDVGQSVILKLCILGYSSLQVYVSTLSTRYSMIWGNKYMYIQ